MGQRTLNPVLALGLSLFGCICTLDVAMVAASCPWDESGLKLWSSPTTWASGAVPGENDAVLVTERVLLDTQPASLANLTVQSGAALIWGNVPDLVLRATYIRVLGEFHIGSHACRFPHKATVKLYGKADSEVEVLDMGRKFLGVGSGGTLELHGQDKMSWTKLAHSIPAPSPGTHCAFVYDHKNTSFGSETKDGMHMVIWKPDGRLVDFMVFDDDNWEKITEFLNIPDGWVMAAAVRKNLGIPHETFTSGLEALGAQLIRSVQPTNQNYAFIAKKGDTSSVVETLHAVSSLDDMDYLHLPDYDRNLDFSVFSASSDVDFLVQNGDLAFPIISVAHDVSSWQSGDEVLVTSTDYDWRQAEVRRLLPCSTCDANQIKLNASFQYMHYGEVTLNVDERAEVALLSRNILVLGELEDSCYGDQTLCDIFGRDTFGAHIKALRGSTVHIQGVEIQNGGQQQNLAAYPLHFHMMDNAAGMWFRNNSIRHSLARCVTIHGTDHVEVSDNVCYDHLGHGFFLEDSVEQNNLLRRNLGAGARHGMQLMSDRRKDWCQADGLEDYCDALSTFWITHPNNEFTDNVAAGSDNTGYFILFADKPLGISLARQAELGNVANYSLQWIPFKRFHNNAAHSNAKSGLFMDSRISTNEIHDGKQIPEGGVLPVQPNYDPRDPPDETGQRVWSVISWMTLHHNVRQNAWVKPGNVAMINSSFADSLRGFGGGNTGTDTGARVKDSVFVARSDNKGMPELWRDWSLPGSPSHQFPHSLPGNPYHTVSALRVYQGPLFVENCHFSRYAHDWWSPAWHEQHGIMGVTPMGAISWNTDNPYFSTPWSTLRGLKFAYCDNTVDGGNWVFHGNASTPGWTDRDGTRGSTVRDADGSLTGQAGTQLVRNRPFFTGPECRYSDTWGMAACPYRYLAMWVSGTDGVLDSVRKTQWPMTLRRDDAPSDPFSLQGETKNLYQLQSNRSYTVNFNQTFGSGSAPTFFKVRAYGIEKGDVVRVALCIPKDTTTFKIRSDYPPITGQLPPQWASSLTELDQDTHGTMFFWDNSSGLLYFKLMTNETRQNESESCAGGKCIRIRIWREDGSNDPVDCSGHNNPPINAPVTVSVPPGPTCTEPASAEGLGAVNMDEIVTADPVPVTCRQLDPQTGRGQVSHLGCWKDKPWVEPAMPDLLQELPKSMDPDHCINRCYERNFPYAGLQLGKRCVCGHDAAAFQRYGPASASYPCDQPCTGDPDNTCGGSTKRSLEVWGTGLA